MPIADKTKTHHTDIIIRVECIPYSQVKKIRVAYQGEEGAYGYVVAKRLGTPVKAVTFESTLTHVLDGDAQKAVMPVENSRYGEVADSEDAIYLMKDKLCIIGEWYEPIRHCLIGSSDLTKIRRVYSHPQALGQCKRFIKKHNLLRVSHYDTAASVSLIRDMRDDSAAAIAGRGAAELYGMKIIKKDINDDKDNTTRFLIIAKEPQGYAPESTYKTTIAFTLPHKKGSLSGILSLMDKVNLTRITSRPTKDWKYVFFVDFEGHTDEYRPMMDALEDKCLHLHVLGSYQQVSS